MLTYRLWERQAAGVVYQEAEELVGLSAPSNMQSVCGENTHSVNHVNSYTDSLRKVDLTPLKDINEEVMGWILIPGMLSYPLMAGEDNHFYLEHSWKGDYNSVGAIFLDCRNSKGLDEFNAILYGHRMYDRSMFGLLDEYSDQDFRDKHPYIFVNTDDTTRIYEVFAAYEATLPSTAYQITFDNNIERQGFLNACTEKSVIEGTCVPMEDSRILTLSTCTGNGYNSRWVVHASLIDSQVITEQTSLWGCMM